MARVVPAAVLTAALALSGVMAVTFEDTRTTAYTDAAGIPTACTGHTGADVRVGKVYSTAQCKSLLDADQHDAAQGVLALTTGSINANELAALTDFLFNVGRGNFASSTLRKKFNAGDHKGACEELRKWVYAKVEGKSVRLNGLVKRRQKEYEVCIR